MNDKNSRQLRAFHGLFGNGVKELVLTLFVFAALTASAEAMSSATASFLRSVGIDPQSEPARVADEDGMISTTYDGDVEENSLESLVAQNKRNGVRNFVGTRALIRKLKVDYDGTSFLRVTTRDGRFYVAPAEHYDPLFLTPEERELLSRKLDEEHRRLKR